jgi:N-methylhydantoinase A
MTSHKLSIDIGGTFVDVVTFDFESKELKALKLPATPHDPAEGVVSAVNKLDVPVDQFFEFVHGTTLGLNSILERKGTTVGIITNEGFRDIFEIGRGSLEFLDMYRFDYEQSPRIVERRHIRGVAGRMDYLGQEKTPLDGKSVLQAAKELYEDGNCKAIAVSFLHAYANNAHEVEAVALINKAYPELDVSSGAMLANEYREYERTSTAVLDAYIKPVLKYYLGHLTKGMEKAGFSGAKYVMNSSGGAMTFELAETQPISTVLSGPAGGVAGALYVSSATERKNMLSVDVGGTSLDACIIVDYQPVDVFEARIDTFPVLQPMFDLRTLGAGGGSIAWVDNKLLRVGPESAGAVPGPACYARGGSDATVTDAALVLGYIDTTNFMGGEMTVANDLAAKAIKNNICGKLNISLVDAARSIFDVLISRTSSSIKEMMLEQGLDPRDFSILAFGGCGPLLGPMLFDQLEMAELVVPPLPSVFSAWGMMTSDLSFSETVSVLEPVSDKNLKMLQSLADRLQSRSVDALAQKVGKNINPNIAFSARFRFIGQEHTLSVKYENNDTSADLFERFAKAHLDRFGHTFENDAEIVSLMIKLTLVTQKPDISTKVVAALNTHKREPHVFFDPACEGFVDTYKINRDSLTEGRVYPGPILVVDEGSSLTVWSNQQLIVDPHGMISITRMET